MDVINFFFVVWIVTFYSSPGGFTGKFFVWGLGIQRTYGGWGELGVLQMWNPQVEDFGGVHLSKPFFLLKSFYLKILLDDTSPEGI